MLMIMTNQPCGTHRGTLTYRLGGRMPRNEESHKWGSTSNQTNSPQTGTNAAVGSWAAKMTALAGQISKKHKCVL